mmetsp:Transcript_155483/g.290140  ORF Transcript_155483/g.290140 Transcript_155483/m.290140 type:complete len:205 (-) Transcript_155483:49-663(-)
MAVCPVAMSNVARPLTQVYVAIAMLKQAAAYGAVLFPLALVSSAVWPLLYTKAITLLAKPLTCICRTCLKCVLPERSNRLRSSSHFRLIALQLAGLSIKVVRRVVCIATSIGGCTICCVTKVITAIFERSLACSSIRHFYIARWIIAGGRLQWLIGGSIPFSAHAGGGRELIRATYPSVTCPAELGVARLALPHRYVNLPATPA